MFLNISKSVVLAEIVDRDYLPLATTVTHFLDICIYNDSGNLMMPNMLFPKHTSCNEGYLPREPVESQCLSTLRWSRAPPVCTPVTCGEPPAVDKADFTFSGKEYLSSVTYTCREGYR